MTESEAAKPGTPLPLETIRRYVEILRESGASLRVLKYAEETLVEAEAAAHLPAEASAQPKAYITGDIAADVGMAEASAAPPEQRCIRCDSVASREIGNHFCQDGGAHVWPMPKLETPPEPIHTSSESTLTVVLKRRPLHEAAAYLAANLRREALAASLRALLETWKGDPVGESKAAPPEPITLNPQTHHEMWGHSFRPCRSDQCELGGIVDCEHGACHYEIKSGYWCGRDDDVTSPSWRRPEPTSEPLKVESTETRFDAVAIASKAYSLLGEPLRVVTDYIARAIEARDEAIRAEERQKAGQSPVPVARDCCFVTWRRRWSLAMTDNPGEVVKRGNRRERCVRVLRGNHGCFSAACRRRRLL